MPTLNWIGKEQIINHHNDVPFRVLERKYSFGDCRDAARHVPTDTTTNKIIHGDNLEALKALLPEYEGRIKCIYIDPPYNTGNENWVYNDNVNSPKIRKWLGQVVGKESEDLSRHDKWLCMMYPRLVLLQKLLSDDGAIFISIDDNEQANLKLICDEIFGAGNFVGQVVWFKKRKGSFLSKKIISLTEYVLCYTKRQDVTLYGGNPDNSESQPIVKRTNAKKTLTIPANTVRTKLKDGTYYAGIYGVGTSASTLMCDVIVKNNVIVNEFQIEAPFTWGQKMLDEEINNGTELLINTLNFQIRVVRKNNTSQKAMLSFVDGREKKATNEDAYENLKAIFSKEHVFEFSKPYKFVSIFIDAITHFAPDSIILDSFAGSGTTAHAVLNLNKQDGGNRKFILVEMEDYAETITAERVRRVINGYGDTEGTGGSFDFYELGEPVFDADGNLNETIATEKIREYIWYSETRMPFDVTPSVETPYYDVSTTTITTTATKYLLGNHNGTAYYFYYEPDKITTLDKAFLNTITQRAEQYVIYADNCLLSADFMQANHIIFKKIPRDIKKL